MDFIDKDIVENYPNKYVRVKTQIPIDKSKADLDSTDPALLEIYKNCAREEAIKMF